MVRRRRLSSPRDRGSAELLEMIASDGFHIKDAVTRKVYASSWCR